MMTTLSFDIPARRTLVYAEEVRVILHLGACAVSAQPRNT
jgi:hypothetical protein